MTHFQYSYIPVHLEYVLTEILKNAFRATVEQHHKSRSQSSSYSKLPPVIVTIAPPVREGPTRAFLSLRIRDQGGGVSAANMARIFSYSFTTAGRSAKEEDEGLGGGPYAAQHVGGSAAVDGPADSGSFGAFGESLFSEMAGRGVQMGMGTIAGLGYGLPMSRLYAK